MIQVTAPKTEDTTKISLESEILSIASGLAVVGLGLLGALYLYSTGHLTYEITRAYGPNKPEIINLNPQAILQDLIRISASLKTLLSP